MVKQRKIDISSKFNALLRYVLAHTASKIYPLYIVNEYPKSGGSWVASMLSDAIGVPFPRNCLPKFESSILHGHMMHKWNMHNILIAWRDGRDVIVSLYYHSLFVNDKFNSELVTKCRADLAFQDYEDIENNLEKFMEYVFEIKRHPKMSWADFVNRWEGRANCVYVKYEELHKQATFELIRIMMELTGNELALNQAENIVNAHSFKKLSGRKTGSENIHSFMRKGIVGDWKNYFNRAARQRFDDYAGEELIVLGYELDHEWVKNG